MTASERSILGLAKQVAKGTPNTTDAQFKYLLYTQGSLAPTNNVLPLDEEVGGGAMLRDMVRVGVVSGGALELIPRPNTIGEFLYGALGSVATQSVVSGGTPQVETATVVASGGVTGSGYATVVVTAAGVTGSPITFNVWLASGDTAAQAAAKIRAALSANANLTRLYAVSGTGASVILTRRYAAANDGTLNIAIDNGTCTGLTTAASSTDTTAGVAGTGQGAYLHSFMLPTDQFAAPYYTLRSAPGAMWGEQLPDCRVSAFGLDFRAANFLRAQVGLLGGTPSKVATTTWDHMAYLDSGPQFITCLSDIELPLGSSIKVMGGSFTAGLNIPLDEQWIIGSYSPDDFDIVSRQYALTLNVKITDGDLYTKMSYDPAGGTAWVADLFREGRFDVQFLSNKNITGTNVPYSLSIRGNGGVGTDANVVWTATPVATRAGRQVIMSVTGVFLGTNTGQPITVELVNNVVSY